MIANPQKFQFLVIGDKSKSEVSITINGQVIRNTETVKLLGITLDSKLSFLPHVKNICRTANQRTKALIRIRQNYRSD